MTDIAIMAVKSEPPWVKHCREVQVEGQLDLRKTIDKIIKRINNRTVNKNVRATITSKSLICAMQQ
ncbi:hypothetical protein [Niveispirillum irakense]|uniref:hypothetical protein n=1 Tax=Niveispirillum irakense TaxID=34011 RepID=UPI0012B58023|nr:hypothetical protein [Niveispirillum irakense]